MRPFPLISTLALLAAIGCDTVKEPIPPALGGGGTPLPVDTTGNDTVAPQEGPAYRRVLLEDFNGHRCNNCPAATNIALGLVDQYGHDKLVLVGIHVLNQFAAPYNGGPPGSYQTDFRTPAGTAYAQSFSIPWLPVGMVNRRPYNGSLLLEPNVWASATASLIDQPGALHLDINALQYTPGSDQIGVMVKMTPTEDLVGEHRLVIYLTEDPVVDWQFDNQANPPDVQFYPHRHVLRGTVTDPWGETVVSGQAPAGQMITRYYTYTLPANVREPDNCAVVAYLYRVATEEVLQVAERRFVP